MTIPFPEAVSLFFQICNGAAVERVADCFTPDATVVDENRTHRGIAAIQSWQRQARQAFTFDVTPIDSSGEGALLAVRARVAGNFPGSPVVLEHRFVLEQDRIRSLEIRP